MGKKNKGNKVVPSITPPGVGNKKDEAQFHLIAPFGPAIGMVKMPDSFVDKLLKVTDDILADKDRIDWGEHLVGQINEEPWVPNKVLEEAGLMEAIRTCLHRYTTSMLQRQGFDHNHIEQVGVHMDHMWIVSQYENEYNPAHFHTFCDLSAVIYLKIPKFSNRMEDGDLPKYKSNKDGQIEFIYKSSDANACERGTMMFKPEPGMMLLFPSNLLHTVYPFKGDGERRSVAFNSHWSATKKGGGILDKSIRIPVDQTAEKYLETLKSKGEVSRYAIEDNK